MRKFSDTDKQEKKVLFELLSEFEVDAPIHYRTGKPKRYYPIGKCFVKSCDYVLDCLERKVSDIVLCHGTYFNPCDKLPEYKYEPENAHAWVEIPGDIVFDSNLQRFYKKVDYYKIFRITKLYQFTAIEVCEKMAETKSYGEPLGVWKNFEHWYKKITNREPLP